MPSFRTGKIVEITDDGGMIRARVALDDGDEVDACGWPAMLGPVAAGDRVVVNTTGIELELGTGGEAFILWNLDGPGAPGLGPGHIVKLRYTPWQTEVLAAEEPDSPHHDVLKDATSIEGMPVVACSLHSQVAGVAAGIKARAPDARVGYLMTDGAALPLSWSRLVGELKAAGLVDVTATCGNAFGGDLETVNVFSGLAALRHAGGVHGAIVAMGPGVVGTATALGFTGMEQGQVLDAVYGLGGESIACLRISFADARPRHRGVSHHALTALMVAAREVATVVIPELPDDQARVVDDQLRNVGLPHKHVVVRADGTPGVALLRERGITPSSMGRSFDEVPELFAAAAAAGSVAAGSISSEPA